MSNYQKAKSVLLGLRLATDESWVKLCENNLEAVLSDHAWCEQKAALNAISTMTKYPMHSDLVEKLTKIAIEEMEHFQMVVEKIRERGMTLQYERKDSYVGELAKYILVGGGSKENQLVNRMLFSAMIEARSCERFRLLTERLKDPGLIEFYRKLMISEAHHYTTFLGFARKYGGDIDVDKKWQDFLDYEGEIIKNYSKEETMHG
ncbi:MAG: tRNA 2-methylthio-N6-isopentenyl adenosine(37) hydroxylase MiaE [Crocinitomicaceae bacterium]|nr:tRNA 2-methylthio-N6-isopentenyl adenosine(37) hydroxylase MiaE [Crocinitomicaceae bacterium]|tara:strand:- start:24065 stop:24679 length:615 start_codon:yes stop_codon:yes gene_type:complete